MRVAVYSVKSYDEQFLAAANSSGAHEFVFLEPRLTEETALLAQGSDAVCTFVNDDLSEVVLEKLVRLGIRGVALRSAGFNHVDLAAASRLGMQVVRVPDYSPHAVAEHCATLVLALNRKIHRAYQRVREGNFALGGLMGFDLYGKSVGIVGTGQIGACFADIMLGFGCRVVATDPFPDPHCEARGVEYLPLDRLLRDSDIVSLHVPLTPETDRLINAERVAVMRDGVTLINTSRGRLIDTPAVIQALKIGKIGYLGLDVYEEEEGVFFEDYSERVLHDDVLARLLTFPNVLVTGHQGFFTEEALQNIAETTVNNLSAMENASTLVNEVTLERPDGQ
ncbi:2-hydroxyacid dehydrogenase [Nesterenkonia alkaliphila]|uniref:2-hydroxyacid dehydrogenase n=1 Tax=Nesterenkonia alkaliphila TaxID=1463631 RepID=A0A7K1UKN6_9MICC|nr:2-hydroxyacid dehydrogenase [Nesterenkonia alkaliphila]MVT27057.1 2-hydroxyacid dehydrogenase [Nesterenkonia alkaliphila]GFZ93834.1 lactate dehydrogenase [Nesterenkonia alkaliphila]